MTYAAPSKVIASLLSFSSIESGTPSEHQAVPVLRAAIRRSFLRHLNPDFRVLWAARALPFTTPSMVARVGYPHMPPGYFLSAKQPFFPPGVEALPTRRSSVSRECSEGQVSPLRQALPIGKLLAESEAAILWEAKTSRSSSYTKSEQPFLVRYVSTLYRSSSRGPIGASERLVRLLSLESIRAHAETGLPFPQCPYRCYAYRRGQKYAVRANKRHRVACAGPEKRHLRSSSRTPSTSAGGIRTRVKELERVTEQIGERWRYGTR
jgi:hypothetical protein